MTREEWVAAWRAVWSSCLPADRAQTEAAIKDLYRIHRFAEPAMVWVRSPAEAITVSQTIRRQLAIAAEDLRSNMNMGATSLMGREQSEVLSTVTTLCNFDGHLAVFDAPNFPKDVLGLNFHYRRRLAGISEYGEIAAALYCRDELKMPYQPGYLRSHYRDLNASKMLDARAIIARQIWYWWPFRHACILCERPEYLEIDEGPIQPVEPFPGDDRGWNGGRLVDPLIPRPTRRPLRLHSFTGPAVRFRDGFAAYAVRGVVVPPAWLEERDKLAPEVALTWSNIEQRRIAAELIGWDKILPRLNAVVIDKNPNPQIGTLLQADLPNSPGERFLQVQCGTGRTFVLPVPRAMLTALAANAWTYNVPEEYILKLEART